MAKNNKTRFFYDLHSDKTSVFDQSERAYYPIYIMIQNNTSGQPQFQGVGLQVWFQAHA